MKPPVRSQVLLSFGALVAVVAAGGLASAGCELIAAVDRGAIPGAGGAGGVGGGEGGVGGAPECSAAADCGADTTCATFACDGGKCGSTNAPKGTKCTEDMGEICDGEGACVAAACIDVIKDGDETDVDCGGSCPKCDNTKTCLAATDCKSGFCDEGAGVGGTTAVCAACTDHAECSEGTYCDAAKDGGTCVPKKADGAACAAAPECISDSCADGVCCDTACDDTCQACTAAKTGATDGTCAPVMADTDPDDECVLSDAGCQAGVCSGAAAGCKAAAMATECRAKNGDCDVAETCDGTTKVCPVDIVAALGTPCGEGIIEPTCDPDVCTANGTCNTTPIAADGTGCGVGMMCSGGVCQ